MKKLLLSLALLGLIGLPRMNAQQAGNAMYNPPRNIQSMGREPASNAAIRSNNEIVVEVNGLMNIAVDDYVAVFSIVQVAETADSADQIMNRRISLFQQELKKAGILAGDIKVDMISFVPKYDVQIANKVFSKSYNEVPAGFELQKNILVYYKNSAKTDEIVSAAAKYEIYDLVKVDYFVSNIQRSLDSLRTRSIQALKVKTKTYQQIGFKLDTLKKVMSDNFTTVYPQTRYVSYQAFSRPSLNGAKRKVSEQLSANEVTKTTSAYYNPVSYDQYDLVVNPIITEPVVQLSYTVTVKYFVNTEEKQHNSYYVLTPSGDLKQINPK